MSSKHNKWNTRVAISTATLCLLGGAGAATAGDGDDFNRFRLSAGSFFVDLDTEAQINSTRFGRGSTVDLERDLGLAGSQDELFLSARYSFNRKHSIGASFVEISRDARVRLERDLVIGDAVFTLGADTESRFDYSVLAISYSYTFLDRDRLQASAVFGLSAIDIDLDIRAELSGGAITLQESEQEKYPVPTLGLAGRYRLAEEWYLRGGVGYFQYGHDDWDASMLVSGVNVEFFPWTHIGFSAGYDRVDINYDEDGVDPLYIDYVYDGILVRIIGVF